MNTHKRYFAKAAVAFVVLFFSLFSLAAAEDTAITYDSGFNYTSEIKYPFFKDEPKLNQMLHKEAAEIAAEFQKSALDVAFPTQEYDAPYNYELIISTTKPYHNKDIISFFLYFYVYESGAHGMSGLVPFNYNKKTKKLMSLKEVFQSAGKLPRNWLTKLSDEARRQLLEQLQQNNIASDEEWIHEGTQPDEKNFSRFNIEGENIRIVFGLYEVAAYVSGMPEIIIPRNFFK